MITTELQRVLLSNRLNYIYIQFANRTWQSFFSLGTACIMCDLDSTSDKKWPSHYTIYHKKLSNGGLVSAVGIVWEPHVRFPGSNTSFTICQLLMK